MLTILRNSSSCDYWRKTLSVFNVGFLKEDRRVLAENSLLLVQFGWQGNRTGLAAGKRKLRMIMRKTQCARSAAGPCMTNAAGHSRHLRIAESLQTNLVIGADEFPGGGDIANGLCVS